MGLPIVDVREHCLCGLPLSVDMLINGLGESRHDSTQHPSNSSWLDRFLLGSHGTMRNRNRGEQPAYRDMEAQS
jgi:hypothetical protein